MSIAPTPPSRSSGGVSRVHNTQSRAATVAECAGCASESASPRVEECALECDELTSIHVGSRAAASVQRDTSSTATSGAELNLQSLRSAERSENVADGDSLTPPPPAPAPPPPPPPFNSAAAAPQQLRRPATPLRGPLSRAAATASRAPRDPFAQTRPRPARPASAAALTAIAASPPRSISSAAAGHGARSA